MQIMAADGYLSESQCGAQPGQPVSFNVAGTRVGIQIIPANSTGPRVVVPTNAGAQALARQRVVARPPAWCIRTDKELYVLPLQMVQVLK